MPAGIFLLGMHRSGTSAVARALNLLGLRLGAEEDLMPATQANAHGYWESTSLTATNDSLLAAAGGSWDVPPALNGEELVRQLQPHRTAAYSAFATVYGPGGSTWLWKDPRNCLLLPFWEQLLGLVCSPVVLAYRHPLEVARSLAARDGFPLPLGLALWETYTSTALAAAAGRPVFVAAYDRLLSAPEAWCSDALRFLTKVGAATEGTDIELARTSVDAGVRHTRHVRQELLEHPAVSPEQVRLFDHLEARMGVHDQLDRYEGDETPWVPVLHEARRSALPSVAPPVSAFGHVAQLLDQQEVSADLTVCIVTSGGGQQLMDCLASVLEGIAPSGVLDVVVVDNASTDETQEILSALSGEIRSVRHERQVEPGRAWASGCELARGEAVLFITTDVRLTPQATGVLLNALDGAEGPISPAFSQHPVRLPTPLGADATTCVLVARDNVSRSEDVPVVVRDAQAQTS